VLDFSYGSDPSYPGRCRGAAVRIGERSLAPRPGSTCSGEYKAGRLTEAQLRQLLGFQTRDALDGFLKSHEVWLNYTKEDLERERAAFAALGLRKLNAGSGRRRDSAPLPHPR